MEPHRIFAAIASLVTSRLTLFRHINSAATSDPALHSWLFQHPELEHPELLLTQIPKEAAFSSLSDSNSPLER